VSGSFAGRRLALLAVSVMTVAGAASVAQAQDDGGLDGFTPEHATLQRQYEARFQQGVSAEDLGRLNRSLSRRPHLLGTANQQQVIKSSLRKLRSYNGPPRARGCRRLAGDSSSYRQRRSRRAGLRRRS
jgi:hypothetical protein